MHPKCSGRDKHPLAFGFRLRALNESNLELHARLPVPPGVYPWIVYQENIHRNLPSRSSGSKRRPDPVMSLSPKWEVQKTESWEFHCTSLYSGAANSLLIASNAEPNCCRKLLILCNFFFYSNCALPVLPSPICSSCCSPAPALGTNLQSFKHRTMNKTRKLLCCIAVNKEVLVVAGTEAHSSLRSERQLDRYHGRTTYADTLQLNPPP